MAQLESQERVWRWNPCFVDPHHCPLGHHWSCHWSYHGRSDGRCLLHQCEACATPGSRSGWFREGFHELWSIVRTLPVLQQPEIRQPVEMGRNGWMGRTFTLMGSTESEDVWYDCSNHITAWLKKKDEKSFINYCFVRMMFVFNHDFAVTCGYTSLLCSSQRVETTRDIRLGKFDRTLWLCFLILYKVILS